MGVGVTWWICMLLTKIIFFLRRVIWLELLLAHFSTSFVLKLGPIWAIKLVSLVKYNVIIGSWNCAKERAILESLTYYLAHLGPKVGTNFEPELSNLNLKRRSMGILEISLFGLLDTSRWIVLLEKIHQKQCKHSWAQVNEACTINWAHSDPPKKLSFELC